MRFLQCIVVILAGSICSVWGQVRVHLELDQNQYLVRETVIAKVRVTNLSGRTLHLGKAEDWLTFEVEGRKGPITKYENPPVAGAFELETSKAGTKEVDIAPYFGLSEPGHYKVTATVQIPELEQVLVSAPVRFDILKGAALWSMSFGVPSEENNKRPEVRNYELVKAVHLKELKLYFRLTNESGTVIYRVYPLGRMVSFSRPEPQLDKHNNLHVLYQYGARSYLYVAINPAGEIIKRQTHMIAGSRPELRPDNSGGIRVAGGVRRLSRIDIPRTAAPAVSSSSSDASER